MYNAFRGKVADLCFVTLLARLHRQLRENNT